MLDQFRNAVGQKTDPGCIRDQSQGNPGHSLPTAANAGIADKTPAILSSMLSED
jgi:hypothetical protein